MKRNLLTPLGWLTGIMLVMLISAFTVTNTYATITGFTASSAPTTYTAGQSVTIDFTIIYATNDAEYLELVSFTFPSGVTVTGVSGRSPWAGCAGQALNSSFTASVATWVAPGHPTQCGAFSSGTYAGFMVTVSVSPSFTGPLTVQVHGEGDGWLGPISTANTTVTLTPSGPVGCTNPSDYGTITAPTTPTPVTITNCIYAGEYNTVTGCVAGSDYTFTAIGGAGNFITIHQGTPNGTVLGAGTSPLTVTCTANGNLYVHVNTDASCGTDATCHTTTVACSSCTGASDPCTSITPLTCGTAATASFTGAGLWPTSSCGWSTPGQEKIYSFTPTASGTATLVVTATNSGGWVDYQFKAASGGCSSSGWTCISDIYSPGSFTFTVTGGVTYYLLLDPETAGSVSHTFRIDCLVPDPCTSITPLPCGVSTSATFSGAGSWPSGSCGWSTPGQEKIYSFTPTASGTATLVVTSTNSGGFVDYQFKAASGGCSNSGWTCISDIFSPWSFTFSVTAGTTYYLLLDAETTNSVAHTFRIDCPAACTPSITVTENSGTPNDGTICSGESATLTAAAGTSYSWSTGATTQSITVSPTSTTTYSVTVTGGSCPGNASTTIAVNAASTATAGSNSPVCAGATINLTSSGGASYSWSGPGGWTSSDQNPSRAAATTAMSGTYTVTVTNTSGCTATASTTVTVNPTPTYTFTSDGVPYTGGDTITACHQQTLALGITSPNPATYTFTRLSNGNVIASGNTPGSFNFIATNAKEGFYEIGVTNANNCVIKDTIYLLVNPLPNPTATATPNPICQGEDLQLGVNGNNNFGYAWSGPNGFTSNVKNSLISGITTAGTGTYTVTVTNFNSCSATATTNVTVNPLPNATAGSNSPVCAGATINLTSSGGTGYSWSGPGSWTSTAQNPTRANATVAMSGTYTVTVTDANGCSATAGVSVTVNPLPNATASSNSPVCVGATINLTSSGGASYSWSGPGGWTSSDQNPSRAAATTAMSGTYTVTVTNTSGCTATASTTVTVNPTPTYTFTSDGVPYTGGDTITACHQETLALEITSPNPATYTITRLSNGNVIASGNTPGSVNFLATNAKEGFYEISITNAYNCVIMDTIYLLVNPLPNPTATATPNPICQGEDLQLGVNGNNNFGYAWSGPNGFTSNVKNPLISGITTAGTGTYTVTVTNFNSCSATATTNVIVNPLPNATAGSNSPVCAGGTINLTSSGGTSYSWSGPGGWTITAQNPTRANATVAMSGTYTVTVTDANGCSATANVSVTVNPLPNATASSNSPVCAGATINLTSSGGTSYSWSGPGGFSSTLQNPTRTNATAAMAGTYTVTVTDGNGCSATATTNVTVNPLPTPTAGSNSPVCAGNTINLTSSGGTSYSWSGPGGFTSILQNPTRANATVAMSGTYTVTVTNSYGCSAIATTNVTVNPLPNATAGSNSPVCAGNTINLTSSGGTSYSWSGPGGFTSTLQNPTRANATVAMSGTYTVTVTDANGCSATASVSVTVNPLPNATASSNSPVCAGATINLTSSGGTSYSWSGPGGWTSTAQNPTRASATVAMSGTYTVTVTDANGCSATAGVSVTVNPLPNATASSNSPVCTGNTINLTASGGTSYSWSGPGGWTSTLQNPTRPNATAAMAGTYTVTVTSAAGCSSIATTDVIVNPVPIAVAMADPNPACSGHFAQLFASGGVSYAWSGPGGFSSTQQNPGLGLVQTNQAGTYTVTVTNEFGCSSTASVNLVVNQSPNGSASISTQFACVGTTVQLNASGGQSYLWRGPGGFTSTQQNPVINVTSHIQGGTYWVTISNANGCYVQLSVELTVSYPPAVTATHDQSTACTGSTLKLFGSGVGTYLWTGPNGFSSTLQNPVIPNVTPANSGTYTLKVTAAGGCSATASTTVNVVAPPNLTAWADDYDICEFSTAYLHATGATNYEWNGPWGYYSTFQDPVLYYIPAYMTGTYTVTGTGPTGCTASSSFDLRVYLDINGTVSATPNPVQFGGTVQLLATGGTSYLWSGPNGFYSTQPDPVIYRFTKNNAGIYVVIISNEGGCELTLFVKVDVINPKGGGDNLVTVTTTKIVEGKIYPNPASSHVTLQRHADAPTVYSIIDMQGRIVVKNATTDNGQVNIEDLAPGVYNVMWSQPDVMGDAFNGRFVKVK